MKNLLTIILLMISLSSNCQKKAIRFSLGMGGNYSLYSDQTITRKYGGIQEIEFKTGIFSKYFESLIFVSYGNSSGKTTQDRDFEELFDISISSLDFKCFHLGIELRVNFLKFSYISSRGGKSFFQEISFSSYDSFSSWGDFYGFSLGLKNTWPTQLADFTPFLEFGFDKLFFDKSLISEFDGKIKQTIKFGFIINPY
jgi:hypothetical protein